MPALAERLEKIPALLEERAARYRVPGASLAVLSGAEVFESAVGVVNLDTRVETTPDAVFQIGSITKLLTTTLIMQLVDEGRVELDEPVRRYLPDFQLGNAEAAARVTVRQLLTHSSGIDGDFFQDTGRGDDCVERYVLACSGLGQLFAPGSLFSYCNSGFVIAGRIIETLRGTTWDKALRTQLLDPIGAQSMHTLPEQALYYRSAVGHVPGPEGGELGVASPPFLVRSNGPAGATPFAAARDLLSFARLHLSGGCAPGGRQVLSAPSVAAMQEQQLTVPDASSASGWGLGWMLFDWGKRRVLGHDGGTLGQSSYFRVVPESDVAVALLTNGGNTAALYRRVFDAVLEELAGIRLPALPEPRPDLGIDATRYVGCYETLSARAVVEVRDRKLVLVTSQRRSLGPPAPDQEAELVPVSDSSFCFTLPESRFKNYVTFLAFDREGRAGYLHLGGRTSPRVG